MELDQTRAPDPDPRVSHAVHSLVLNAKRRIQAFKLKDATPRYQLNKTGEFMTSGRVIALTDQVLRLTEKAPYLLQHDGKFHPRISQAGEMALYRLTLEVGRIFRHGDTAVHKYNPKFGPADIEDFRNQWLVIREILRKDKDRALFAGSPIESQEELEDDIKKLAAVGIQRVYMR